MSDGLLTAEFCTALQDLVTAHHSIYPRLPPRDIFFEDLVARAFQKAGQTNITLSTPGRSKEDMAVGGVKLSIKTETGYGTNKDLITITKLSTTETDIWQPELLIGRILEHLAQYELVLMLRAIWQNPPAFQYQLLSIPLNLLLAIRNASLNEVGKRAGRRSIGGDILYEGEVGYHVHFDGADGKCQVRNLPVAKCVLLDTWVHQVPKDWQDNWPIRTSETSEKPAKKRAVAGRDEPPSNEGPQLGLFGP